MNKRIQELIKQCTEKVYVDMCDGYDIVFDKEKFAKLIWEEAYQEGFNAGGEDAILKERG